VLQSITVMPGIGGTADTDLRRQKQAEGTAFDPNRPFGPTLLIQPTANLLIPRAAA